MERRGSLWVGTGAGLFMLAVVAASCTAKQREFGTGGGGATSSSSAPAVISMIDDMEDMNGDILMMDGRLGAWYLYNDGTGTQMPMGMPPIPMTALTPARGSSKYGAHTSGMGFMTWGAGFGFDLNNTGGMAPMKLPYDASTYAGIHFWAKSSYGGPIRFNVGDGQTTPEGGKCTPSGMAANCSDDFGQNITLTTDWQEFTIKFSEMTQVGWSKQNLSAIDKKTLYSVHFQAGTMVAFDIWIDDVAFFQ